MSSSSSSSSSSSVLQARGTMIGHSGWVTSIVASPDHNTIVSAGRDKSILLWRLTRDEDEYGVPKRSLRGHNHFVSDVALSSDGQFCLSSSWDATMRLWDLSNGKTTRRFIGHKQDVLSVAMSADNCQIVSGSRDRTVKLWNTIGECKFTLSDDAHTEWVTCVRFSPDLERRLVVSASCDKTVKVWNISNCKLLATLSGHTGYVNQVSISPDGSLCASGGKDGNAMLWDLSQHSLMYQLESKNVINALAFSPNRYWLCTATTKSVQVWDLQSKEIIADIQPDFQLKSSKAQVPYCVSVAWSTDGNTLFAGYTDSKIRVFSVRH